MTCLSCQQQTAYPSAAMVPINCQHCGGFLVGSKAFNWLAEQRRDERELLDKAVAQSVDQAKRTSGQLNDLLSKHAEALRLSDHYSNAYFTLLANLKAVGFDIRLNKKVDADVLPAGS